MTPEEKVKKIEEIYERAREKLLALQKEQKEIITAYIKELEQKKIEALKEDIKNLHTTNK